MIYIGIPQNKNLQQNVVFFHLFGRTSPSKSLIYNHNRLKLNNENQTLIRKQSCIMLFPLKPGQTQQSSNQLTSSFHLTETNPADVQRKLYFFIAAWTSLTTIDHCPKIIFAGPFIASLAIYESSFKKEIKETSF